MPVRRCDDGSLFERSFCLRKERRKHDAAESSVLFLILPCLSPLGFLLPAKYRAEDCYNCEWFTGSGDGVMEPNQKARSNPKGLHTLDGYKRGLINSLTGICSGLGLRKSPESQRSKPINPTIFHLHVLRFMAWLPPGTCRPTHKENLQISFSPKLNSY